MSYPTISPWVVVGTQLPGQHAYMKRENENTDRYLAELNQAPSPMLIVEAPSARSVFIATLSAVSTTALGVAAFALLAD